MASIVLAEILLAIWLPKVAKVILFTFAALALLYMAMLALNAVLQIRWA